MIKFLLVSLFIFALFEHSFDSRGLVFLWEKFITIILFDILQNIFIFFFKYNFLWRGYVGVNCQEYFLRDEAFFLLRLFF